MTAVSVCIGVHVHAEPERLKATLDHLRAHTDPGVELILLGDGPDPAVRAALAGLSRLRQLTTAEPAGAPACFNRLAAATAADVVVFLESGTLVGPDWLAPIQAAFAADPRLGLAGPATNRTWSAQALFPHAGASRAEIARTAADARRRYGSEVRTVAPLYGLGDFCLVVRRAVIAAIGGADPAYGRGPCWEIDYTVRAARAGFAAVWVPGAFVYRLPFTARRAADEARLFEASKRLFQDRFCGLRLAGARQGYAGHCQGDDCGHFAPAALIRRHRPLQETVPAEAPAEDRRDEPPDGPLVSCTLVTRDRPEWVAQSIRYFQRQDYRHRELVIVAAGAAELAAVIPCDPRIRLVRLPGRPTIGAMRNHACQLARGDILVHWDDDDWYGPARLSRQVQPILDGSADITGLVDAPFFDLDAWRFWLCSPELHKRMFAENVHGGTLAFRRALFDTMARYPNVSLAEDAAFLRQAVARGARLARVDSDGVFVYLRHGANAWRFACGAFLDPAGWLPLAEPAAIAADRDFYAARSRRSPPPASAGVVLQEESAPAGVVLQEESASAAAVGPEALAVPASAAAALPLVSCIMPTFNRRPFVRLALDYFRRQDYPRRELIIVDDGTDPVADLVGDADAGGDGGAVRYLRCRDRQPLGQKRNAAIEASQGDIILHWDDDDWMAPTRIRAQVDALTAARGDICGASEVVFCELASGRLWLYRYPDTARPWLCGGTLCYRRSLWAQKRFQAVNIGEDTRFVWAPPQGLMVDMPRFRLLVALVHPGNTSPKPLGGPRWSRWQSGSVEALLGADWSRYRAFTAAAVAG